MYYNDYGEITLAPVQEKKVQNESEDVKEPVKESDKDQKPFDDDEIPIKDGVPLMEKKKL